MTMSNVLSSVVAMRVWLLGVGRNQRTQPFQGV